jgi:hypothetical protein
VSSKPISTNNATSHLMNSAKLQRQQQNRDAYRRRVSNSHSPTEPHVYSEFPASLRHRAAYKIRSTSHFIEGYRGLTQPTLILGIWEPRYLPIVLLDTTTDDRLILDNLHNINGHQLRLLEEQGHERRRLSMEDGSSRNLVQAMLEEIDMRIATWIIHNNEFEQFEGSEWETMKGELALEWGAKIIHCLRDEVWVRQLGCTRYLEAYESGGLAWQSIDVIG